MVRSRMNETSYVKMLREQMSWLLPHEGLPLIDRYRRWSDRLLVMCAVLMCLAGGTTLLERFTSVRDAVVKMYASRRRPGASCEGFFKTLSHHSDRLLKIVIESLRRRTIQRAGERWMSGGGGKNNVQWCVMGVDGTKIDVPKTTANEKQLGVANKQHAAPQMLLVVIFHLATHLPWAFRRDKAAGDERGLLIEMLDELPPRTLIAADAGFVGRRTAEAILEAGRDFLLRAGANVRLLRKLGFYVEEHDGIVYLWPDEAQKMKLPPIVLRQLIVTDGRNRQMCLLTSVLDPAQLTDAAMIALYKQRWGVELAFRAMKQTLRRSKMLATSPGHAQVELDWTVIGLWMLGLINQAAGGVASGIAATLRIIRRAMRGAGAARRSLIQQLRAIKADRSRRAGPKQTRHWPRKARAHSCSLPLARMADEEEIALAQRFSECRMAA